MAVQKRNFHLEQHVVGFLVWKLPSQPAIWAIQNSKSNIPILSYPYLKNMINFNKHFTIHFFLQLDSWYMVKYALTFDKVIWILKVPWIERAGPKAVWSFIWALKLNLFVSVTNSLEPPRHKDFFHKCNNEGKNWLYSGWYTWFNHPLCVQRCPADIRCK